MRIKNKVISLPKPSQVIIYRENENGEPDNLEFLCGAVVDYVEFEKLAPAPKPPLVTNIKTNNQYHDTNDRGYKEKMDRWGELRITWLIITSLKATEGLEWDTVKYDDPETWGNYQSELRKILTESEINRLINGVLEANSPTSNRRREALDVFTATPFQEGAGVSQSQKDEHTNTPSGVLANG